MVPESTSTVVVDERSVTVVGWMVGEYPWTYNPRFHTTWIFVLFWPGSLNVAYIWTPAPLCMVAILPPYMVTEDDWRWLSNGRDKSEDFCCFTLGSSMKGSRIIWPEFGSGNVMRARVPVISADVGLIPKPTHPEGEMNVPEKTRSNVPLFG